MGLSRHTTKEINAGSMADIAFLLLIFFLVVTTIQQDQGILVTLPPYEPGPPIPLNEERVLSILINSKNMLLVENQVTDISNLTATSMAFLKSKFHSDNQPVISIKCDRQTNYNVYLDVYDRLKNAYTLVWDEISQDRYQRKYITLSKTEQKTIRKEYPLIISEAETTDFSK